MQPKKKQFMKDMQNLAGKAALFQLKLVMAKKLLAGGCRHVSSALSMLFLLAIKESPVHQECSGGAYLHDYV